MAEIIIDNVKYTNVPNKKAGTKFASTLTQSNIGMSQAVQDYVNSSYFYALVNAIDINWDGIEIGENSYINTTSDLIKWIESKAGDIDLSSYATITYVNDKITELIGAAPETLDTLGEIAAALQDDASLAYVTQALEGKANVNDVYTKTEVDNLIPAPVDLSNYVSYTQANSYYVAKEDMPDLNDYATTSYVTTELDKKADKTDIVQADMCETDTTSKSYVLNNPYQYHFYNLYGSKYYCYNLIIPHNTNFNQTDILNSNIQNCVIIGNNHKIYTTLQNGLIQGYNNKIQNDYEVAFGQFNSSTHSSDASIRTIFSIGNGDLSTKHNALEVKGNGQIYIADTKAGTPYSLQSRLNSKANANDVYTKTEVDNLILAPVDLSNYVSYTQANSYYVAKEDMPDLTNYVSYTDANSYYMTVKGPKQVINSVKTFVGNKLINFKQGTSGDKLGFTLYNSDEKDVGGLEYRPDTINGNPLISLQHYVNTANMSTIPQSYLGFRQTQGNKKYHLLAPIPADVATIETITGKNYKNFFMPLVFKNGSNKVYTDCTGLVDMASLMPDLNDYTTTSYVTTELNKKADLDDIPDLTPYVTYTDANTYYAGKNEIPDMTNYVDINSYNALAARVEELASWIVAYHTPGPGPEPSKPYATAQWLDSSGDVVPIGTKTVVAGDSTTYTFTFYGTPATGWTFTNTGAVQIMNTTTGDITIDVSNYTTSTIVFASGEAYYPEDSSYQSSMNPFSVTILPAGMNPQFYYDPISCNISSTEGQYMPAIYDTIGEDHTIEYASSDSNVASVGIGGTIFYVSAGNCTITATAIDGSNNTIATATIDVTCYVSKNNPSGGWYDNGSMVSEVAVNHQSSKTLSWSGNPESGWIFNADDPSISVNQITGEITISNSAPEGKYHVSASYTEDSLFYGYYTEISIRVIGHDEDPNFYFNNYSTSLNDTMTTSATEHVQTTYMLNNGDITWYSSDNSVATVTQGASAGECIITYKGAGSCYITASYSGTSGDASAKLYVTCTSSAPTPEYTNVNMYYKVGENYDQTISKGYFDTDPIENGVDYNGHDLRIVVEFEGPQYTYNSGDFTITKDSTYDSGEYIQIGSLNYESGSYNNGINSLEFSLDWYVAGSSTGTNRFIFDFSYNGVSLISDGIKIYNNGEVC